MFNMTINRPILHHILTVYYFQCWWWSCNILPLYWMNNAYLLHYTHHYLFVYTPQYIKCLKFHYEKKNFSVSHAIKKVQWLRYKALIIIECLSQRKRQWQIIMLKDGFNPATKVIQVIQRWTQMVLTNNHERWGRVEGRSLVLKKNRI